MLGRPSGPPPCSSSRRAGVIGVAQRGGLIGVAIEALSGHLANQLPVTFIQCADGLSGRVVVPPERIAGQWTSSLLS